MTWAAEADTLRFAEAVDWFARRVPITDAEFARNVEQAHRQAFWIAGVTRAEVIRSVFDDMKRALEQGIPFEEWKRTVGPKLEREWLGYGLTARQQAFRTELVLRNWSQGAYNRARWAQMNEPSVKRFRPYGLFDGVADSRQSEICAACDGTVLPLDHPWWATHRPPMHHACRSGIRNVTRATAEGRGLTKRPPEIAAKGSFGSGDEYSGPDRSKFPNKLKPPMPPPLPKPPAPAPPPAPAAPLLQRREEFLRALDDPRNRGADARAILREQVKASLPGAVSRDVSRGLRNAGGIDLDDAYLQQLGANAIHDWDGNVVVRPHIVSRARVALQTHKVGNPVPPAAADGLRVLVHEELHGHSRVTTRSYSGLGAKLEEVGTELNARRIVGEVLGRPLRVGSYQDEIDKVRGVVRAAVSSDLADDATDALIAAAHERGVLGPGPDFTSPKTPSKPSSGRST